MLLSAWLLVVVLAVAFVHPMKTSPTYHLPLGKAAYPSAAFYDKQSKRYNLFSPTSLSSGVDFTTRWVQLYSTDLTSWTAMDNTVINSEEGSYDSKAILAGSMTSISSDNSGKDIRPVLIYSAMDDQDQTRPALAFANNGDYNKWVKSSSNPVDTSTASSNGKQQAGAVMWKANSKSALSSSTTATYWLAIPFIESSSKSNIALFNCPMELISNSTTQNLQQSCQYFSSLLSVDSNVEIASFESLDFFTIPSQGNSPQGTIEVFKYTLNDVDYYTFGIFDEKKGSFDVQYRSRYDFGQSQQFHHGQVIREINNQNSDYSAILQGYIASIGGDTPMLSLPRSLSYSSIWQSLLYTPASSLTALRDVSSHYHVHKNNLIINHVDERSSGEYLYPLPVTTTSLELHSILHMGFDVEDNSSFNCMLEVGFLSYFPLDNVNDTSTFYEHVQVQMPSTYLKHSVGLKFDAQRNIEMFTIVDSSHLPQSAADDVQINAIPGNLTSWLISQGNHDNTPDKTSYGIDVDFTVYYDQQVVEVFVLDGISASSIALTSVQFNAQANGLGIYVKSCNNNMQQFVLHEIDAWKLQSNQ